MHENHASIVALHRLKPFFKKSADTFASTQYNAQNDRVWAVNREEAENKGGVHKKNNFSVKASQ